MTTDQKDDLQWGDWVLIGIAVGTVALFLLCGGCITVRNEGSGSVIVTKTITSDASIPASVIP
jgi:hypothetical protein